MAKKKTNKFEREQQVHRVAEELDITYQLAKELLILAGGDEDLVYDASDEAEGLGECRAIIINERMKG